MEFRGNQLYCRTGSTGALKSPNNYYFLLTSVMRYDMRKQIKKMAGKISFSQISDSSLTYFENIYNQAFDRDDKGDLRGISPYELLNTNCRYYEQNHFTAMCNQLHNTLSYFSHKLPGLNSTVGQFSFINL